MYMYTSILSDTATQTVHLVHAAQLVPGVPLGSSHQVKHARPILCARTLCTLEYQHHMCSTYYTAIEHSLTLC